MAEQLFRLLQTHGVRPRFSLTLVALSILPPERVGVIGFIFNGTDAISPPNPPIPVTAALVFRVLTLSGSREQLRLADQIKSGLFACYVSSADFHRPCEFQNTASRHNLLISGCCDPNTRWVSALIHNNSNFSRISAVVNMFAYCFIKSFLPKVCHHKRFLF